MSRGLPLVALGLWLTFTASHVVNANPQLPSSNPAASETPELGAVLTTYCITCHSERVRAGNLVLDRVDPADVPADAETWEKVVRKLQGGMMPPPGMPRPDQATHDAVLTRLETALDTAAIATPNPGRPVLRRLNRTEYANEIRNLLALELDDVAALLPADNAAYGFDNIGDVLEVSPALLERYLTAAERISGVAVGNLTLPPGEATYTARADLTQTEHRDGLPFGTRGGLLVRFTFPVDGEYVIQPRLYRTNQGLMRGLREAHQVEIAIDGERVHLAQVGGASDYEQILRNRTIVGNALDARLRIRVPVKAGPREVGVTFLYKTAAKSPELLQPLLPFLNPIEMNGMPQIRDVAISGPFDATGPGDTPSRRQILSCRPTRPADEASCAREILERLARRAYRRPVSEEDLDPLLTFYDMGRREGGFERGIELALQRLLASPHFVFRIERAPTNVSPGIVYDVGDVELASRLSFFLWSSGPDEELLTAAQRGELQDAAVLSRQVRRMLADPRAQALVTNFAGQWLYLRNLRGVSPNTLEFFPEFDDNLRQAFQRETELFFESIMREDRSVLELLTADFTFVNERLARHYGIPDVYGSHFRRVALTDDARRGLLGKGSILTVTSYPHRTSPVIRGKWILENLLGTPPPPPPPNVPDLPDDEGDGTQPASLRARLEAHRANPVCASCHQLMDPLGLALENFDAIGAWRTQEAGEPIDASGQLADGTAIDGVVTLREALVRQPQIFVHTMAEKLLTYALGRGLAYYDMPAVRQIVRDAAREEYRFSSLVMAIVNSVPFQMRMKTGAGALPARVQAVAGPPAD